MHTCMMHTHISSFLFLWVPRKLRLANWHFHYSLLCNKPLQVTVAWNSQHFVLSPDAWGWLGSAGQFLCSMWSQLGLQSPGGPVALVLSKMAQWPVCTCMWPPCGLWLGSKKRYPMSESCSSPKGKLQESSWLSLRSEAVLFFFNFLCILGCSQSLLVCVGSLWLWWAGAVLHCGAQGFHRGSFCCSSQALEPSGFSSPGAWTYLLPCV